MYMDLYAGYFIASTYAVDRSTGYTNPRCALNKPCVNNVAIQ